MSDEFGIPEDFRELKPVERALAADRSFPMLSYPALKQERRSARPVRPGIRNLGIAVSFRVARMSNIFNPFKCS
jgi:hypothetical protein